MALLRTAAKSVGCQNCQQWVLRSFLTSIAGLSATQPLPQRRHISRPARLLNEARERIQLEEQHVLNEINALDEAGAEEVANEESQLVQGKQESGLESLQSAAAQESDSQGLQRNSQVTHIPWYLQQSSQEPAAESPLAARQRLPELPEYPPALLQPLLEHVSVELGMDSLSLLDLRELDPPPALGANLLMIVGTARSEKHLHVSADRLCRWLRTEYKMTPFADGLLGRNELKLKMKRKAKRARLMSAVGAKSAEGELDDGLRTGWVCINLGRVEGGELPDDIGKVQRAEGMVGFGAKTTGSNIVVQLMTEEKRGEVDLEKLWMGIMNRARKGKASGDAEEATAESSDIEGVPDPITEQTAATGAAQISHNGHYTPGSPMSQQVRAYHTTARRMQSLEAGLSAVPTPEISALSMRGSTGSTSHEELSPYTSMAAIPQPEHWHAHIQQMCNVHRTGVSDIDSGLLEAQLQNMQLSGLIPQACSYELVIQTILSVQEDASAPMPEARLEQVLNLMEEMEVHGYNPFTPPVLLALHRATVGTAPPATLDASALLPAFGAARLRRTLLNNDWPAFWKTWRSYPQRFLPRTAEMYTVLFEAVAAEKMSNIREAREVLREAWGSMQMESPAVELSAEMAHVVLRAIEVVDPEQSEANGQGGSGSEWADARRWCAKALRER